MVQDSCKKGFEIEKVFTGSCELSKFHTRNKIISQAMSEKCSLIFDLIFRKFIGLLSDAKILVTFLSTLSPGLYFKISTVKIYCNLDNLFSFIELER